MERLKHFFHDQKGLIRSASVLSASVTDCVICLGQNVEKKTLFCHHSFVSVFIFPTVHPLYDMSLTLDLFLFDDFISFLCVSLTQAHFSWMSLLFIPLLANISKSQNTRSPCQEDTIFTICVFARENMHECLSLCVCVYLCT